jgi:NADH-quinone oxidoreductase subunit K
MPTIYFFYTACVLFCLGLYLVLTRRNAVGILMGVELILNAANLNLVAFGSRHGNADGVMTALFIIVLAAAEAAVALAIILNLYDRFKTVNVEDTHRLKN